MIGHLRGTVIDRGMTCVLIDCGGVGYEVTASSHTLSKLNDIGAEVSLRIYTHFLEHKISLYGFASVSERELFDLLITVKNVGPASAIKILSAGAGPIEIAQLVAAREPKSLMKIKGIGKKTAEMLVVELHEKCEALLSFWGASTLEVEVGSLVLPSSSGERFPLQEDVIKALVQLGYRKPQAEKVVDLLPVDPGASLETVMRQALQAMPR